MTISITDVRRRSQRMWARPVVRRTVLAAVPFLVAVAAKLIVNRLYRRQLSGNAVAGVPIDTTPASSGDPIPAAKAPK